MFYGIYVIVVFGYWIGFYGVFRVVVVSVILVVWFDVFLGGVVVFWFIGDVFIG